MSREESPEIDDELFNDIYGKAYTGPSAPATNKDVPSGNAAVPTNPEPGSKSNSEEEQDEDNLNDPFAIPTDFTSRDKKFWDAKAKATEKNFNKRKKEEMICKLCGDPNHFTQGCPSTLGMNKNTNEYFQRIAARDKRIRDLFSPETISQIEKEIIGCKITMNEKFLIVGSKETQALSKGIDKVHNMIQEMQKKWVEPDFTHENPNPSPPRSRVLSPPRSRVLSGSRSRDRSPPRSRVSSPPRSRVSSPPRSRVSSPPRRSKERSPRRRERSPPRRRERSPPRRERGSSPSRRSERSYSPRSERSRSYSRSFENRAREDPYRFSKDYPKHGAPSPSSTRRVQYEGQNRNFNNKVSGWDVGEQRTDPSPDTNLKASRPPASLDALEMEIKREEMEMMRARDQQVDEENYKYRQRTREMRETYASKFSTLRSSHSKQWDDFVQHSVAKQPQISPQPIQVPYPDPARAQHNMQYTGPTSVPHNSYPHHGGYGYEHGRYQS